jgi:hypothetical protein
VAVRDGQVLMANSTMRKLNHSFSGMRMHTTNVQAYSN